MTPIRNWWVGSLEIDCSQIASLTGEHELFTPSSAPQNAARRN